MHSPASTGWDYEPPPRNLNNIPDLDFPSSSFELPVPPGIELPPGINDGHSDLLKQLPYEFITQVSSDERRLADLRERASEYLRFSDAKVLADEFKRKDPYASGFVERQNEAARRRNESLILQTKQQALELKARIDTSKGKFNEQKLEFMERISEMVPVLQREELQRAEYELRLEQERLEKLRLMRETTNVEQQQIMMVRQQQQVLHREVETAQRQLQESLSSQNSPSFLEKNETVLRTPAFLGKGRRCPNSHEAPDSSSPQDQLNKGASQHASPLSSVGRKILTVSMEARGPPSKMSSLQSTPRGHNEPSPPQTSVPSHTGSPALSSTQMLGAPLANTKTVAEAATSVHGSLCDANSVIMDGVTPRQSDGAVPPISINGHSMAAPSIQAHSIDTSAPMHHLISAENTQSAQEEAEDDSVCRAVLVVFFAAIQHASPRVDQQYINNLDFSMEHWQLASALETVTSNPLIAQSINSSGSACAPSVPEIDRFLLSTGLQTHQVHAMAFEFLRRYCGFPDRPFPLAVAASACASTKLVPGCGMTATQFAVWKVVAAHLRWLARVSPIFTTVLSMFY